MERKMKSKAIIGIAVIVAILASAIGVVSAAEESVVKFEDQGYTIKMTFPDGGGIALDGVQSERLRGACNINRVLVHVPDIQRVTVRIEVEGISNTDWSLSKWKGSTTYPFYSTVYSVKTTKESEEFILEATRSDMPSNFKTRIYRITVEELGKSYYEIYFLLVQVDEILRETKPTTEEEKYTLTLEHYPPYYKPRDGIPWRAGDLVATLTDKDSNSVSDKTVFFYVEPGTNLKGVLENSLCLHLDWTLIKHNFPKLSYVGYAYTNNKGIARFNYIRHRCIKADILSERIRDTGENIKGPIVAAVFNQELTAIEQDASVVVEFSGIARITNISVHGTQADILGKKGKILFTRINKRSITVHERDCLDKGYDLLCDDVISLDKDDCIELLWLDGMKIKVITKPHVLKEDMVDITIGKRELAHQLSRDMYDFRQHDLFSTITIGGAGAILGFCALPIIVPTIGIPVTTVGAIGYPALALGLASIGIAVEGIYYGETPFVISRMKSKILVDPTSSGINFYTVEGSNELTTPKGSKREIITGHKISLLPDGTFSQISEFDRDELSEDLSYLLESIEKDESDKQSELEISKVYVGKPIYPRETEVDMHYEIKNIG
jgi:hypothetical protein